MQRINLKKHKELLDFEGVELLSYGVHGPGKSTLSKEASKRLPYLYYDFQKIEALDEKIKKLEDNVENGKPWREYFISGRRTKWAFGIGETAAYLVPAIVSSYIDALPSDLFLSLFPLGVWALFGLAIAGSRYNAPYAGPTGCAKALVDKATYKPRKKLAKKIAERKKAKQETKIKPKIELATSGELGYTEKWLKKEKKGLEEMLLSANPEFAERFTELQKIIRPEHQLEFFRHFEEFAKEMEPEKWSNENIEKHLSRYNMTKGSGIWAEEAKKAFEKEVEKREASFKAAFEPMKDLPEDPKKEKLIGDIEKLSWLNYALDKGYPRISRNDRRRKALKEFYNERLDMLWTAKRGELEILTGNRRGNTKRQRIAGYLEIPYLLSLYAMITMESSNPFKFPMLGVQMLFLFSKYMIRRRDDRAQRQIRAHLREHERGGRRNYLQWYSELQRRQQGSS